MLLHTPTSDTGTMFALATWLCTLLAISRVGSASTEAPRDETEVSLLRVGVSEIETQLGPNPAADGYNSRHLRAIYHWPEKRFCHYKFKVEAVTTVEVAGGRRTSRHFLIVTLDHRPLDILELGDSDSFFTDNVKLGRFCLEYRMVGGGCRAREYRRAKTLTSEVEEEHEVIVEDWKWEATDDECENHQVIML